MDTRQGDFNRQAGAQEPVPSSRSGLAGFQNRQSLPEDGRIHLVLGPIALLGQQKPFEMSRRNGTPSSSMVSI